MEEEPKANVLVVAAEPQAAVGVACKGCYTSANARAADSAGTSLPSKAVLLLPAARPWLHSTVKAKKKPPK